MNVMGVLERIKGGERVMVSMPGPGGKHKKYSLTDGTEVSDSQFFKIKAFLAADDAGLLDDAEPQSYRWAG